MANNVIKVKRTSVSGRVANTTDIANSAYIGAGEFALNMTDGILFSSNGSALIEIGANNRNVSVSNTLSVNAISANSDLGSIGEFLTSGGASGTAFWRNINTDNVLYVAKNGSDTNGDGSINNPYLTIKKAVEVSNTLYNTNTSTSTTISVQSGLYTEVCPIEVPKNVSIIGDSLRGVSIKPSVPSANLFYLNNGSYIKELTVRDYESPSKAFSFNPANTAGVITRSPYILNCTSLNSNGTALYIDGEKAQGNRSIIAGLFTIINPNGRGVHITNRGYSQLVNIYTICTDIGVLADHGGFCTLNCSDSSFGNYGLIANGTSSELYSGTTYGNDIIGNEFVVEGLPQTPFINNTLKFDGVAQEANNWYTITKVTPLASNTSTVTLLERVRTPIANNTTVKFYQRSYIAAAGHAFEYVGTGTTLANASPFAGGISNTERQAISSNGGSVNYTATDQFGNFFINNNLSINGSTATIEGEAFQRSIFGLMTPYILAIEGS